MSLRLITGAANSGKTGEVLKETLSAAAAGAFASACCADACRRSPTRERVGEKESAGSPSLASEAVRAGLVAAPWRWSDGWSGPMLETSLIAGLLSQGVEAPLGPIAQTRRVAEVLSRLAAQGGLEVRDRSRGTAPVAAIGELLARYRVALEGSGLVEEETVRVLASTNAKLPGPSGGCAVRYARGERCRPSGWIWRRATPSPWRSRGNQGSAQLEPTT